MIASLCSGLSVDYLFKLSTALRDHGQLTDDGTRPEHCEHALAATRLGDARFGQPFLNPVASVALTPRSEQSLIGRCTVPIADLTDGLGEPQSLAVHQS